MEGGKERKWSAAGRRCNAGGAEPIFSGEERYDKPARFILPYTTQTLQESPRPDRILTRLVKARFILTYTRSP